MIKVITCINMLMKFFSTFVSRQLISTKTLNETNYVDQAKFMKLYMVVTNLDLTLKKKELVVDVNSSAKQKTNHEK